MTDREQITETEPSVSTAGSRRMRAFRRSIRWAPSESAMVTTAGIASGIAATARLTEVSSIVSTVSPCMIPIANNNATMPSATMARTLAR